MDRLLPDPEVDMYRKCARCEEKVFFRDPPHLCKDVRKRLQKRERQRDAVLAIFEQEQVVHIAAKEIAEKIVETLMKMGVEDD